MPGSRERSGGAQHGRALATCQRSAFACRQGRGPLQVCSLPGQPHPPPPTHLKRMVAERPAELEMRAKTRPSRLACISRLVSTCAAGKARTCSINTAAALDHRQAAPALLCGVSNVAAAASRRVHGPASSEVLGATQRRQRLQQQQQQQRRRHQQQQSQAMHPRPCSRAHGGPAAESGGAGKRAGKDRQHKFTARPVPAARLRHDAQVHRAASRNSPQHARKQTNRERVRLSRAPPAP